MMESLQTAETSRGQFEEGQPAEVAFIYSVSQRVAHRNTLRDQKLASLPVPGLCFSSLTVRWGRGLVNLPFYIAEHT